ncbi:MAG: bifunctional DNA-formamidopyrimidine glycosylase/DNA-(apurinic or apyrimidinic site) lyase [Phycisphaerales bacterium]|jgi:formamidopyrimidine-DNA glycosylase
MPELPEVETVRRTLEPRILGRRVAIACLRRRDICELLPGTKRTPEHMLQGATIAKTLRHGKQLALVADTGQVVCIHLGMSGVLSWATSLPRFTAADHAHAWWRLDDDSAIVFADPRRFGGLWLSPDLATLRRERWGALGIDALLVYGRALHQAAGESERTVKAALLDQGVVAGVGNIYADESLFVAGIAPTRACLTLSEAEWERLAAAIRKVLGDALEGGGSTLRDYRDANGQRGTHQLRHAVYGRAGEACVTCRGMLQHATLGQRMTVWCATCQK